MDTISGSCYDVNAALLASQRTDEKYCQILGSIVSLGKYEKRNFKNLGPQILAALAVTSFHLVAGIALIFSAILVPQLQEDPEFKLSENEASWIGSIVALIAPVGTLMAGFFMDHFGRLNGIKLAAVPAIAGWIVMALAQNFTMLMTGRILTGLSIALGTSPAVVYITEIARLDMRASLTSLCPAMASFGMILTFLKGWFMNWRHVAWTCNIYAVISVALVCFIPESPAWLVSRGRITEAKYSLNWLSRHQPQPENRNDNFAGLQLALLQKEHELKMIESSRRNRGGFMTVVRELTKPTGYKPMLILMGVFVFQQFSGIFIFMLYSINFYQATGTEVNPYLASMFIGIVRFIMSLVNTYIMKAFGRRPLVIVSCLGMSLFILLSALFTYFIKRGATNLSWLPVLFLLLYVIFSMVGLVLIPFTMSAELFTLEIRGVANSICWGIANILMFLALLSYPWLVTLFRGIIGIQIFFGVVTLAGAFYSYVFLPESHNVKLKDIQEYFVHNVMYLGKKRHSDVGANKTVGCPRTEIKKTIVRTDAEQADGLIEEA